MNHKARGTTFSSFKRIAGGKACPSHRCDVNMLGKFADNSSTFLMVG